MVALALVMLTTQIFNMYFDIFIHNNTHCTQALLISSSISYARVAAAGELEDIELL